MSLRDLVNAIAPISEADWQLIAPALKSMVVQKDEFLVKEGQVCDQLFFIEKGSVRAFYQKSDLTEVNILLRSQHEMICDYESFINQQPAKYTLQAIENSTLLYCRQSDLYKAFNTSFYWSRFGRMVAEQNYISAKTRAEDLMFLSAEERYMKLMKTNPDYFQKYPLKHIAAYLSIAPQSLSRIRARIY